MIKKQHLANREYYLTGILILLLLIFGFLWYSQVTTTSSGLTNFIHTSFSNFGKIFTDELKSESLKNIIVFKDSGISSINLNNYILEQTENSLKYPKNNVYTSNNYQPKFNYPYPNPNTSKNILFPFLSLSYKILITLIQFLFLVGLIYILYKGNFKIANKEYIFAILISVLFIFFMIFLPYFSMGYNFERLYLQVLVFLCPLPLFGGLFILGKFISNKKISIIVMLSLFLILFLFNYGFFWEMSEGKKFAWLENDGQYYDHLYGHTSEFKSVEYINKNTHKNIIMQDPSGNKKLRMYLNSNKLVSKVFPSIITKDSYVYSSYSNSIKKILFAYYKGVTIQLNFPTEFLNDNKNKIYNNGGSEIFK